MSKLEKLEEKNAALEAELDVLRVALRESEAEVARLREIMARCEYCYDEAVK